MNDHVENFLQRQKATKSEGTHKRRKSDCNTFTEWMDTQGLTLEKVDHMDLEKYFLWMQEEGYSPKSVEAHFASLQALFKYLVEWAEVDFVDEDSRPFDKLERKDYVNGGAKKRDESDLIYVTMEEKEKMADNAPSPSFRGELVIRLLWQTGIRKTELRNIKLNDLKDYNPETGELEIDTRGITIRTLKKRNKNEERTVYWQESLDWIMKTWVEQERGYFPPAKDSEHLFVTEQTERFGIERVNWIVKQAAENAGIQETAFTDKNGKEHDRITSHALRHGHAVHSLKCGIDLRNIQKHLGHSSLEQTEKYLELVDDDVRKMFSNRFRATEEPSFN